MPGMLDASISAIVLAAPAAAAADRAAAANHANDAAAAGGGLALTTCHRVELYVEPGAARELAASDPWRGADQLAGELAVRRMISVALGLESAVLAEDQVLHQLRAGVAAARRRGALAPAIGLLADHALRAGRLARSWRPTRPRSLADLAIERLRAGADSLAGRRVLVIGAGEMGRLAAHAAARAGATVTIGSPTGAHATAVALEVGGRAVPYDPGPLGMRVDGVVIALSGPWQAAAATLAALQGGPLVIDLSLPGALATGVIHGLGDRFVDVDRLAWAGDARVPDPADARYRRRLEELRDATVREVISRGESDGAATLARALARHVERQRTEHLEALWSRLPGLSARERAAIEGMATGLTDRLFRAPLARLGSDGDERRVAAARELFDL